MTKLNIDDKEYNTETFSDEQNQLLSTINLGQNAETLINYIHQCVQSVQQTKIAELKETLKDTPDDS
jgi:hypothetical protein|tara:strand:- start:833 stop:1033 length:201 start_codon:yes stop_codon:yes gene_type:complete